MENAFAKPASEVLAALGVDPAAGLTEEMVVEQRTKFGRNGREKNPHCDATMAGQC